MSQAEGGKSRTRTWILGCTLLALAARIAYAYLFWTPFLRENNGTTVHKVAATAYGLAAGLGYHTALAGTPASRAFGALLAKGEGGTRVTADDVADFPQDGLEPETMYPPGPALLGGLIHRFFGLPVWLTWQAAGVLADTLVVPLLYVLVCATLGRPKIARGAMLVYALFPAAWYNAVSMYSTALVPLFVASACVAVVLAMQRSGRQRWLLLVAAGLAIGLGGYFRSDYLLLGASFFPALWLCQKRFWPAVLQTVVVQATAMALLLPWAYRNHEISHRWVFGGSCTGGVLVSGLGAYPNPWGLGPRDQDRWNEAKEAGLVDPFDFDGDLHFQQVFRQAVAEHPTAYLRIIGLRLLEMTAEPFDCGLAMPADAPKGSELRSQGRGLSDLPRLLRAYWSRLLMGLFTLIANVGCVVMVWRQWRTHPLILIPLMAPCSAIVVHMMTFLLPGYLVPAVFAQTIGFVYLLLRGWRPEPTGDRDLVKSAAKSA